jgi:hypothetical protein
MRDTLVKAMKKINYPSELEPEQLVLGEPSTYMKILHYILFAASETVSIHIYSHPKGVSQDTLRCNDYQFMLRVFFLLRSLFNYEPPMDLEKFFTLVNGNLKMTMSLEVLQLVKNKSKQIKQEKAKTQGLDSSSILKSQISEQKQSQPVKESAILSLTKPF